MWLNISKQLAPGVILRDIMEDLESALEQLKLISEDIGESDLVEE